MEKTAFARGFEQSIEMMKLSADQAELLRQAFAQCDPARLVRATQEWAAKTAQARQEFDWSQMGEMLKQAQGMLGNIGSSIMDTAQAHPDWAGATLGGLGGMGLGALLAPKGKRLAGAGIGALLGGGAGYLAGPHAAGMLGGGTTPPAPQPAAPATSPGTTVQPQSLPAQGAPPAPTNPGQTPEEQQAEAERQNLRYELPPDTLPAAQAFDTRYVPPATPPTGAQAFDQRP